MGNLNFKISMKSTFWNLFSSIKRFKSRKYEWQQPKKERKKEFRRYHEAEYNHAKVGYKKMSREYKILSDAEKAKYSDGTKPTKVKSVKPIAKSLSIDSKSSKDGEKIASRNLVLNNPWNNQSDVAKALFTYSISWKIKSEIY